MALHPVARRYAKALIDVALEADAVDAVAADLNEFALLLDAHDGLLRSALCSPVFTTEERTSVLSEVIPKLSLNPLTVNLLRVANDNGRFDVISDIAQAFADYADVAAGRQRAEVITAEPMSPQVEAEIRAALERSTGKIIRLSTKVDPSLIGGMVAKIGGTVYDSSIRNRLDSLKQNLFNQDTATA